MKSNSLVQLNSNYQIDQSQVLGEGASGCVYLGRQTHTKQPVAVKVIDLRTVTNEVTKYLLDMEILALQSLNHPNVLKCYQVLKNQSQCFIITQLCQGKTLANLVETQGCFNEQTALNIILGVLKGYQELLAKKVAHRDLKTANIMLHNGEAKIIDFGYCEVEGHQKPGRKYNVGSPNYMAPETFQGSIYNEKAEVWSIGTIFYEILTGKTLHDGRIGMPENFQRLRQYGLGLSSQTNPLCKKVLSMCLNFETNQRATCAQIIKEIEMSLHGNSNSINNKNESTNQQKQKFSRKLPQSHNANKSFNCSEGGRGKREVVDNQKMRKGSEGGQQIMNPHTEYLSGNQSRKGSHQVHYPKNHLISKSTEKGQGPDIFRMRSPNRYDERPPQMRKVQSTTERRIDNQVKQINPHYPTGNVLQSPTMYPPKPRQYQPQNVPNLDSLTVLSPTGNSPHFRRLR